MRHYYDLQGLAINGHKRTKVLTVNINLNKETLIDILKHDRVIIFGEDWEYDRFKMCEVLANQKYGMHTLDFTREVL